MQAVDQKPFLKIYIYYIKAVTPSQRNSLAGKIVRSSDAWSKRIPIAHRLSPPFGIVQQCDLSPAASRYIIFEGFDINDDQGKEVLTYNTSMKKQFENIFLEHLASKLPSIAIQSNMIDSGVPYLVDLANRNIPVLLLDCTERAITLQRSFKVGEEPTTRLAKESNAFPNISKEQLQRITISEDSVSLDGRKELVSIAEAMIERKWECLIKNNITDVFNASMLAFLHSVLHLGVQINDRSNVGTAPKLHVRIRELEKFERTNKDSRKGQIPNELATRVIHFILTQEQAMKNRSRLAVVDKWLEKHDEKVDHLIPAANEIRKKFSAGAGISCDFDLIPSDWFALFELITSANTYSGSIFDIDELKRILGSVAKIDRLPASNSLEALRTLQDAWDHYELYYMAAGYHKIIAKVIYVIFLLIGVFITILVLCQIRYDFSARISVLVLSLTGASLGSYVTFANPAVKWQQLRMAANTIESNIWTFRTRAGTYRSNGNSDDQSAEKQLIDLLQEVKSTILEGADVKSTAFYSRATSYNKHGQHATTKAGFGLSDSKVFTESNNESEMKATQNGITSAEIMESLDTSNSFKKYLTKKKATNEIGDDVGLHDIVDWLCMGRNEIEHELIDSHYEPLQPDAYIRHRVFKALTFYKSRIPHYNSVRNITQLILVLGSVASVVLAFVDEVICFLVIYLLNLTPFRAYNFFCQFTWERLCDFPIGRHQLLL
jgi:hypothetical protein